MVALSYCDAMTCRVWCGLSGFGAMICEGESARPFGIDAVDTRREWRFELEVCEVRGRSWVDDWDCDVDEDFAFPGMSRTLSFRPVVGSVV